METRNEVEDSFDFTDLAAIRSISINTSSLRKKSSSTELLESQTSNLSLPQESSIEKKSIRDAGVNEITAKIDSNSILSNTVDVSKSPANQQKNIYEYERIFIVLDQYVEKYDHLPTIDELSSELKVNSEKLLHFMKKTNSTVNKKICAFKKKNQKNPTKNDLESQIPFQWERVKQIREILKNTESKISPLESQPQNQLLQDQVQKLHKDSACEHIGFGEDHSCHKNSFSESKQKTSTTIDISSSSSNRNVYENGNLIQKYVSNKPLDVQKTQKSVFTTNENLSFKEISGKTQKNQDFSSEKKEEIVIPSGVFIEENDKNNIENIEYLKDFEEREKPTKSSTKSRQISHDEQSYDLYQQLLEEEKDYGEEDEFSISTKPEEKRNVNKCRSGKEQALLKAVEIAKEASWTKKEALLLAQIFEGFGYAATKTKLRELISDGATVYELLLASELRNLWRESSQYHVNLREYSWSYHNLSWYFCWYFVKTLGVQNIEEIEFLLNRQYEDWYPKAHRNCKIRSFFEYLKDEVLHSNFEELG